MQNSEQLLKFLKSPLGRDIEEVIAEEIAIMQATQAAALTEAQRKQRRHELLRLFFYLSFSAEKEAHAKKLNQEIQKQIDESLREEAKELESDGSSHDDHFLEAQIEFYQETINELKEQIANKLNEKASTENELASLENTISDIQERYQLFDRYLSDSNFDEFLQIPRLLQDTIEATESQMSSYATIISSMLSKGDDVTAKQQIDIQQALHLKTEMLHMIDVATQEQRHFYDQQGNRVQSISEAAFFVPNDKKLTYSNGQYFLHTPSKALSDLTPKQRAEAQAAYQDSAHDMMTIRLQLKQRQAQELSPHQVRKVELSKRSELLVQDLKAFQTLLSKAKDAHLALQNQPPRLQREMRNTNFTQPAKQKVNALKPANIREPQPTLLTPFSTRPKPRP